MEPFINFIFKNFSEQSYFSVNTEVVLDLRHFRTYVTSNRVYYCSCPFHNEFPKTVLLNQVSIKELLHGLRWLPKFPSFQVELNLLSVDVLDYVLELLQRQDLLLVHNLQGP